MKFIVEVNAKYLVSVEADSALRAEHAVLDYDGVWGALAFDRDMMKTDTFRGACLGCETISMKELIAMSNEYRESYIALANAQDAMTQVNAEIADLEERLAKMKAAKANIQKDVDAANAQVEKANEAIGIRKD
jgi:septal ring factor EnvC (AmiA/AmiB activator)